MQTIFGKTPDGRWESIPEKKEETKELSISGERWGSLPNPSFWRRCPGASLFPSISSSSSSSSSPLGPFHAYNQTPVRKTGARKIKPVGESKKKWTSIVATPPVGFLRSPPSLTLVLLPSSLFPLFPAGTPPLAYPMAPALPALPLLPLPGRRNPASRRRRGGRGGGSLPPVSTHPLLLDFSWTGWRKAAFFKEGRQNLLQINGTRWRTSSNLFFLAGDGLGLRPW